MSFRDTLSSSRSRCFALPQRINDPLSCIKAFSSAVDALLCALYTDSLGAHSENVCLIALGGYGRGEMFPYSDIDLLVLRGTGAGDGAIAAAVRALWDTGLSIGCVVRSLDDCKRILGEDLATDIALLESRYLIGSRPLAEKLGHLVRAHFRRRKQWYLQEIHASLREAVFSSSTSLYCIEPHLKAGVCTLRDCQRVLWSQRIWNSTKEPDEPIPRFFSFDQRFRFQQAFATLTAFRAAIHCAALRRIDILEIALQPRVAADFGYAAPSELMKRFFLTVRDVKELVQSYLERCSRSFHPLSSIRRQLGALRPLPHTYVLDGVLSLSTSNPLSNRWSPVHILRIFEAALSCEATISISLAGLISERAKNIGREEMKNAEVDAAFRAILSSRHIAAPVLRQMHETGFLSLLIPEFEALTCKVEYDSYHEYTVDEHIMIALAMLDTLTQNGDAQIRDLLQALPDAGLLRTAVLLHDIGKALPGEHSYTGAIIASNICDRLGFGEKESERIVFLVAHHLELSALAFRREPEDPVIRRFAEMVGDRQNLDMLYLLTILDIRSVGQKTWTAWKGLQLELIYRRTAEILGAAGAAPPGSLRKPGQDPTLFGQLPEIPEKVIAAVNAPGDFALHNESFVEFERLTFCAFDRPRLFADIVACLSSEGYGILSAQISTRSDGRVLDVFQVETDGTTSVPAARRLAAIERKWEQISSGARTGESFLAERMLRYPQPAHRRETSLQTKIGIDNTISQNCSVLEIESSDRFGLLHTIAQTLARLGINIVSARLSTRIDRAVDVFYIADVSRKKIEEGRSQREILESLYGAIKEGDRYSRIDEEPGH
jgi:[protein-PII] uridylyltransferase